jgi:hypothetical protein
MEYQKKITALNTIKKEVNRILEELPKCVGTKNKLEFLSKNFSSLLPMVHVILEGVDIPQLAEEERKLHAKEIARLKNNIRKQRELLYKVSAAADIGDGYL